MSFNQYVSIAGDVKIKMAGAIFADHTVEFDPDNTLSPASDITLNSGPLTFTPANWNVDQNLNVTPKRIGSISIPYKITSAYTRKEKTGQITITVT